MMRTAFSLSLFALVAGCFSPNLEGVSFLCDEANPQCPAGYECAESKCFPTDNFPLTMPDPDPTPLPPDAGGGMMGAAGCASNTGFNVSKDMMRPAFACPGTFTNSTDKQRNVNRLCAAGYVVCGDATRVNVGACNMITTGFFVARVVARRSSSSTEVACMSPGGNQKEALWAGCGRTGQDIFMAPMCGMGFTAARDCNLDTKVSSFGCWSTTNLDAAYNTQAASGALCCK